MRCSYLISGVGVFVHSPFFWALIDERNRNRIRHDDFYGAFCAGGEL